MVPRRGRRPKVPPQTQPFASIREPNDVWSADFKGQFWLGDGQRCYPLTISDNYSRYLLCCQGLSRPEGNRTRSCFEAVFREYGLPRAIRTDNGVPFASIALGGLSGLAVWLLKGFMDEIPREYEEAALVDGYTRLHAFVKVVLPQAITGIAATAIFCLIFAWNEYAFALLLTSGDAQTMPPFIPFIIGEGGQDWPAVAAATTLFVLPILFFTVVLRKHLLRGITFGAVRK